MKPTSIMIVDKNTDYRNTLRHAFEDRGYMTWTCPAPEIASSILSAIQPNIVVLDLDMEGVDVMTLIDAWRELAPNTRVVVELSMPNVHRLREALDHGANAFLVKSQPLEPLFKVLESGEPTPEPSLQIERFTQIAA